MRNCQTIMSEFRNRCKRLLLLALAFVMAFSLTSCGTKKSRYQAYVRGLITANYLGIPSEYVKMTGASEEDAESLYLQNVTRLADNLSSYFGLDISGDAELAPAMVDLARQIYSKAKFEVGEVVHAFVVALDAEVGNAGKRIKQASSHLVAFHRLHLIGDRYPKVGRQGDTGGGKKMYVLFHPGIAYFKRKIGCNHHTGRYTGLE